LVLDVDWAMVSAWAAMVTAVGAIVAIWLQDRHNRVTRSLDLLLRLEGKFDSDRMRELRRKAAKGFLEKRFVDEAYYVMDLFEEAGLLLRMKAIHEEILFESFFHSPLAYWFTARKYVMEMRQTQKELYDNFQYLVDKELVYARRKTGEDSEKMENEGYWKDFIVRETVAS
jgi:hypothetical protein